MHVCSTYTSRCIYAPLLFLSLACAPSLSSAFAPTGATTLHTMGRRAAKAVLSAPTAKRMRGGGAPALNMATLYCKQVAAPPPIERLLAEDFWCVHFQLMVMEWGAARGGILQWDTIWPYQRARSSCRCMKPVVSGALTLMEVLDAG